MEPFKSWCLTKTQHEAEPMCLEESPLSVEVICSKHQVFFFFILIQMKVQFILLRNVKENVGLFHLLIVKIYVIHTELDSAGT